MAPFRTMKAKPNSEVRLSMLHHSIKTLGKTVKEVIKLVLLNSKRKIDALRTDATSKENDSEEKIRKLTEKVDWLKSANCIEVGGILARDLSIGSELPSIKDMNHVAQAIVLSIRKHSKVIETIKDIEEKLKKKVERNSALRAVEQRKEAKKARLKDAESKKMTKKKDKERNSTMEDKDSTSQPAKVKTRYIGVVNITNTIYTIYKQRYSFPHHHSYFFSIISSRD